MTSCIKKILSDKKKLVCTVSLLIWGVFSIALLSATYLSHLASLKERGNLARFQVEEMLANAQAGINKAVRLDLDDCDKSLYKLRNIVAVTPDIRTISLVRNGYMYCNSIIGKLSPERKMGNYQERLYVRHSSALDHAPVMILTQKISKSQWVRVGISEYYLLRALQRINGDGAVVIKVGNTSYNEFGIIKSNLDKYAFYQKSVIYPFSIYLDNKFTIDNKTIIYLLVLAFISFGLALLAMRFITSLNWAKFEVENAIINNKIKPYVQPIVDDNGDIVGGEILARWIKDNGEIVPPNVFIPTIEQYDLMVPMTLSLLNQVIEYQSLYHYKRLHLSFNVTEPCLNDPKIKHVCRSLSRYCDVVLELTENQQLVQTDTAQTMMASMRKFGVKFALDDYGTGYSTLDYLRKIKFDYLKIDKSFVDHITSDDVSNAIIDNIIALADRLNIRIIAEGIEQPEQVEILKSRGVVYFQGYLYGKPMLLDEFASKLV
ncbi:TPA: EAL domain-containing protein [Photobacterium damselae]